MKNKKKRLLSINTKTKKKRKRKSKEEEWLNSAGGCSLCSGTHEKTKNGEE